MSDGKCMKCKKPLNHPLAVKWGIGYECAGKLGIRKQLLRGERVDIKEAIAKFKPKPKDVQTKEQIDKEQEIVTEQEEMMALGNGAKKSERDVVEEEFERMEKEKGK